MTNARCVTGVVIAVMLRNRATAATVPGVLRLQKIVRAGPVEGEDTFLPSLVLELAEIVKEKVLLSYR